MSPVRSVTVRRFKKLEEVSLDLPQATLLVGANNSGKSSVLQAIHFAVAIAQSARLVGSRLAWRQDRFELSTSPAQLLYTPVADVLSLANGGRLTEDEASRVEVEFVSDNGDRCVVGMKRGRNRNIAIEIEGRALGEQLMKVEEPFTIYAPGLAGISREERYLSPGVVRRIVARGDANLVLRNVLLMLHRDGAPWAVFIEDMRSLFPDIDITVDFNDNTDEFIDAKFALSDGVPLPVDAAGTSILQASQIVAYISLFRPKVLILDEPDSHLHPNNQRALCDLVLRLAAERGFQVLISTHSRHVLDSMKARCSLVWLNQGAKVENADINTTSVLLDLGAMDSVDYFANRGLKCVVATEDSDTTALRALLTASGFLMEEVDVRAYTGCSNLEAGKVLGQFLVQNAQHLTFVVHRDRDYMTNDVAERFSADLQSHRVVPFLTPHSDIEGAFLNVDHLHYLNPSIPKERIADLLEQATTEMADESIRAIINQRVPLAQRELRGAGRAPDYGRISADARSEYEADPARMRRGDLVLSRVTSLLQTELGANPRILHASPHLCSAELSAIADQIWPADEADGGD